MQQFSVAVIGAGILGAAVAHEVAGRYPQAEVTIFEKEDHVAGHQTGHNSGVVHAGLYYEPGSLKARLCRRGVGLLQEFCGHHGVAYDECGKIVVALEESEEGRLRAIHERALANGVPDVELIGPEGIRAVEPNAVGRLALHSPHTAIVDYVGVTEALVAEVRRGGGRVMLSTEVTGLAEYRTHTTVSTTRGDFDFDLVVACPGLQSDRLARSAGRSRYPAVVPFFGQYSQLAPEYRDAVNGLVYPVPDPQYPFLGVHVTKRIDGETLVGPNAFLSFGREDYAGTRPSLRDTAEVAGNPGFWKFASGNVKATLREVGAVVSRTQFIRSAAAYVPMLAEAESTPIPRGVRAQAMDASGKLVDDFVIDHQDRTTIVRNAPSPGATSSLAIAEYIVDELAEVRGLG